MIKVALICLILPFSFQLCSANERSTEIGQVIDHYQGVAIYNNGKTITKSHGSHRGKTGYYFGQKWQCVEFVKRFYFFIKKHKMPNVWGHAVNYFDEKVPHGTLNPDRGLIQFRNGGDEPPKLDDLIIFSGKYGHVAIVSKLNENTIVVVQQNLYQKPRSHYLLDKKNGGYYVSGSMAALGWLRLREKVGVH